MQRGRTPWLAVAALCNAGIVVALMQTIIIPLIPGLPGLLDAEPENTAWALTITLLVGAVVTPISGRLGDMYGKRRILLLSLLCVAIGSIGCALSPTLLPFLIGRGLQGLGIGTIPLGISIMRDIVPQERLGSAIGMMSGSLGIGSALGLPFAASIAQAFDWHTLFVVSAGVALVAMVGVTLVVREPHPPPGGHFDFAGAAGLLLLLTAMLLPLSRGAAWGWSHPATLGLLAASAAIAVVWGRYELGLDAPLIDLRIVADRPVLLTNLASVAIGFAFYTMQMLPIQLLMTPEWMRAGMGFDMLVASLILTPAGLLMFLSAPVCSQLCRMYGPRIALAVGAGGMGVAFVVLLLALADVWQLNWVTIAVVGALSGGGLGVAYAAMPAQIMRSVPAEQTAEANGVNSLARAVGTSLSTAVVGMVLAWSIRRSELPASTTIPSTTGYVLAGLISLGACGLAVAMALAIPRRPRTSNFGQPKL
ncbi:putative major facilitator superfamily transporter [Gordonia araii NBRC 100433]|uniref:Putative major facilitator superfamily transporter n=1 Tax=Gordonia araii NBRC 100433 TaxID=1073574 RepID=G7GZU2_9ACTN|nr:MFS transporter [Gordonia araii]NNG98769.1 MFS transporter [Gordonia araii NBRC 100433]GAB09117.1 putative major facilitator superfamily transporter [Gordonia araii NBRC 100433]